MENNIESLFKALAMTQFYQDTAQTEIYTGSSTDQINRAARSGKLRVLIGADGVRRFDTVDLDRFVRAEKMQDEGPEIAHSFSAFDTPHEHACACFMRAPASGQSLSSAHSVFRNYTSSHTKAPE